MILNSLLAKVLSLMWLPNMPSCTSIKTRFTLLFSKHLIITEDFPCLINLVIHHGVPEREPFYPQVSNSSTSSWSFIRYLIIWGIHPSLLSSTITWMDPTYILGLTKVSCITILLRYGFFVLESVDNRLTLLFSSHGTWITLKKLITFSHLTHLLW